MIRNVDCSCGSVHNPDISRLGSPADVDSFNQSVAQVSASRLTVVRRAAGRLGEPAVGRISSASLAFEAVRPRRKPGPSCETAKQVCGLTAERGPLVGKGGHWYVAHEGTAIARYHAVLTQPGGYGLYAGRSDTASRQQRCAEPEAAVDLVSMIASQEAWHLSCGVSALAWRDSQRTSARCVVVRCPDPKHPCTDALEYMAAHEDLLPELEWVCGVTQMPVDFVLWYTGRDANRDPLNGGYGDVSIFRLEAGNADFMRGLLPPLHNYAAHYVAPLLEGLYRANQLLRDAQARLQSLGLTQTLDKYARTCSCGQERLCLSKNCAAPTCSCRCYASCHCPGGLSLEPRVDPCHDDSCCCAAAVAAQAARPRPQRRQQRRDSSDLSDCDLPDESDEGEEQYSEYDSDDCEEVNYEALRRGLLCKQLQRSGRVQPAQLDQQPQEQPLPAGLGKEQEQLPAAGPGNVEDTVADYWYSTAQSVFGQHATAILAVCGKNLPDQAVVSELAGEAVAATGAEMEGGPAVRGWLSDELRRLAETHIMQTGNAAHSSYTQWLAADKDQAVSALRVGGRRGRRKTSDLVAAAEQAGVHLLWIQQALSGRDWLAPARVRPPITMPAPVDAREGGEAASRGLDGGEAASGDQQPLAGPSLQQVVAGVKRRVGGGGGGGGGGHSKRANLLPSAPVLVGAEGAIVPEDVSAAVPAPGAARAALAPRALNCVVSLHNGGRVAGAGKASRDVGVLESAGRAAAVLMARTERSSMGTLLDNAAAEVVAFLGGTEGTEKEKQLVESKGLQSKGELTKLQAPARALMLMAAISQAGPPKLGKENRVSL